MHEEPPSVMTSSPEPDRSLPSIRFLLVDDHAVMRSGLRLLIESQPGWVVIGEAGDRATAIDLAAGHRPDIIILDLDLGGDNALDFLPELLGSCARILVLTGLPDSELHLRAFRLGARGIVFKENAAEILIKAIVKVNGGGIWLDPSVTSAMIDELQQGQGKEEGPEAKKIATLTRREREVIALVCTGQKNKAIAESLSISEATVRNHLTSILRKLGLPNRFALALYAFRHGMGNPPGKSE